MDLQSRTDIENLVNNFYKKVMADTLIGDFFNKVVKLDFDKHLTTMYDFWETTLLGCGSYKGNPMVKHFDLNKKKKLEQKHFDRWLNLWEETVNELFSGPKSEESIKRAGQIAAVMQLKIRQTEG